MEFPLIRLSDDELRLFCQQAAVICHSKEFKKLHKEMVNTYRKMQLENPSILAFQDSLFSLYLEENQGLSSAQGQLV